MVKNCIFEQAIQNDTHKEELIQALDEMNRFVSKLENKNMMKDLVESWHKFVKYITDDVPQYMKKHTVNTIPHIISFVSEMKNRQDIIDGKLNLKQALKRASGSDIMSFLQSRLIDVAIQIGSDINSKDCGIPIKSIGLPSLHYATLQNNYNCASTFINRGANVVQACKHGIFPLHYAFINEKNQHLNDCSNADILSEYIKENSKKLRSLLIEKNTDMNLRTKNNETALHYAMLHGTNDFSSLDLLFAKGASANVQEKYGNTPLHVCSFKSNIEHMSFLAKYKANPNIQNSKGCTPLHWSARKKDKTAYDYLITMGADKNIKNNVGITPWEYLERDIGLKHISSKSRINRLFSPQASIPSLKQQNSLTI